MGDNQALTRTTRKIGATALYTEENPARALRNIERSMGGRQDLIAALFAAGASDDLAYVIGMIADPRNDARDLPNICAEGGITIGELMEAYKRGCIAAAQVASVHHVAAHLSAVAEDVMVRARPYLVECLSCLGQGLRPDPEFTPAEGQTRKDAPLVPCEPCKGTGQVTQLPDLDRQKVALELGGLGPKRAPLVDMSDRRKLTIGDTSAAGFVDLLGAVDQFLYRRGGPAAPGASAPAETDSSDTIDADPIPGDTPSGEDAPARETPPPPEGE